MVAHKHLIFHVPGIVLRAFMTSLTESLSRISANMSRSMNEQILVQLHLVLTQSQILSFVTACMLLRQVYECIP